MKSTIYLRSLAFNACIVLTLLGLIAATPLSRNTFAEEDSTKALDSAMDAIAHFEAGKDSAPLVATTDAVIAAFDDAAGRATIAKRLATLLESDATLQGKEFVCKQLYLIGGDEIIPVLAKMLNDEKTADMARYALQRMAGEKAGATLLHALKTTSGKVRIGVINSLGGRREIGSVKELSKLVSSHDSAEASAAIRALGKIANLQASKALATAKRKVSPALYTEVSDARLRCAHALLAAGNSRDAEKLYSSLYIPKDPSPASVGAFLGLAAAKGDNATPIIVKAFMSDNLKWQNAAAEACRAAKGNVATQVLTAQLPSLAPRAQALLATVVSDRGDTSALPVITELAGREDPAVRLAALQALGRLGNTSSVPSLTKALASADKSDVEAAQSSLVSLRGNAIDAAITQALSQSEPKVKTQLIHILALRNAVGELPALFDATGDTDAAVRSEAFDALGTLAKPEQLPNLANCLINARDEKARNDGETAVVKVAQKANAGANRAGTILAALPNTKKNVAAQASLLRVLGLIGDDSALPAIRAATTDPNAEVKEAAVRALAAWPNDAVLSDLQRLAQTGSESQRLAAVRGFLRVLTLPSKRSDEETLRLYELALRLSPSSAEKKTALAGLANVHTARVKAVVRPFLNDPEFAAEAQAALGKLAKTTLTASALDNNAEAKLAIDGKLDTRWSSNAPQKPGQWFQVDLGWERSVSSVTLDSTPSAGDYPRGYEVYVSSNTTDWGKPVAKGNGNGAITEIKFAPKDGRYVRVVQTGTESGLWWSIHEIKVDSQ